jgi:hypothetical protein
MKKIKAYKTPGLGNVSPLSIKREWMDNTWNAHAYHCFPVGLANQLGWGISFPEDITFIWDGISDTSQDHVKILKGKKYAYSSRANATVSFHTGIMFETDEDTTLLQMPVPNQPIDGITPFSTLISTSFYKEELPCAWMITKPNVEITIKANTPIIAILPLNLSNLQGSTIEIYSGKNKPKSKMNMIDYSQKMYELNNKGEWSDFYRNSVDHKKNKIGSHQVKTIKLNIETL